MLPLPTYLRGAKTKRTDQKRLTCAWKLLCESLSHAKQGLPSLRSLNIGRQYSWRRLLLLPLLLPPLLHYYYQLLLLLLLLLQLL